MSDAHAKIKKEDLVKTILLLTAQLETAVEALDKSTSRRSRIALHKMRELRENGLSEED